ncbi:MAG: hypothetical protein ABIO94_01680 [Opitutaceae bacterium]
MNVRKPKLNSKDRAAEPPAKKAKRRSKLSRLTRGALLAVGLTAAQLSDEADFVGDEVFHRNLVDRLHAASLTRYHD